MLATQRMSGPFRKWLGYVLAACFLSGFGVVPHNVLCVESGGRVDIEVVDAACCAKDFGDRQARELRSCGDCCDTLLGASLQAPSSHLLFSALVVTAFVSPVSLRSVTGVGFSIESLKPLPQEARPPGIALLC
jgi:hypothetical protein